MATQLKYSPLALDFGTSPVGTPPANQTITLTATGGTVQVTALTMSNIDFALVSPPSLPFNVTSTQALTISFTPSTKGAEPGTLTVTSNAGTGNSLIIPLVGIGGDTYTQYSLPQINNLACGVVKCYAFLDSAFPTLIMPTKVPFLDIGEIKESIDAEVGAVDIGNVDVTLAEDYGTYDEGFWYKLIMENPTLNVDLMFTVMNGVNEEFLYRGTVYRQGSEAPEYYLDTISAPTKWGRGMKVQLVSSLINMQYSNMDDFCTIALSHATSLLNRIDFQAYPFVSLKSVFASMMELAFASNYDESLIVDNGDFQISNATWNSGTPISWIDGLIMYSWFVTSGNLYPYTSWNQGFTYYDQMSNPWELLKHICGEFGVIPRYTFGNTSGYIDAVAANNKHRITFNTRGKSGNLIAPTGNVIESSILAQTSRNGQRLHVSSSLNQTDEGAWFWDGNYYDASHIGAVPPSWRVFDKTISFDFVSLPNLSSAIQAIYLLDVADNYAYPADLIHWWNYSTAGYSTDTYFCSALSKYFFYRYTGRIEVTRTYGSITASNGSTTSQMWLQTLQQEII